jgi:hypothetical protein
MNSVKRIAAIPDRTERIITAYGNQRKQILDLAEAKAASIRLLALIQIFPDRVREFIKESEHFCENFTVNVFYKATDGAIEVIILCKPSARLKEFLATFGTPDVEDHISIGQSVHSGDD